MRRLIAASLAVVGFVGPALAATTPEPRVALVIGNSAYEETPLANPVNDARLMADTLRDLGFEVIERTDINQKAMKRAIIEFGDRLNEAGKDAVGLFFYAGHGLQVYAGHGLQVNGNNYLVPLDAEIERESYVDIEAVRASWVLGEMEVAGNRMNFVILDACRNNPLTRSFRSPTRGLARMQAPQGSLIAYSTAPGRVSRDGAGANSPYSLALARAMRNAGVPVEQMFKQVRDAVMAETGNEQVPWEESSLTGEDFYFNPAKAAAPAKPPASTAALAPLAEPPTPEAALSDAEVIELVFWQSVVESSNLADYRAYLQQFPDGIFAGLASARVDEISSAVPAATPQPAAGPGLIEQAFWDAVADSGNLLDVEVYLQQYPKGHFATLARARIGELGGAVPAAAAVSAAAPGLIEQAFWDDVAEGESALDFEAYLQQYPEGHFAAEARTKLAEIARLEAAAAERQRVAAEDAERRRIAAEEAERERLRVAAEERQRKLAAEAERQRLTTEEAKRQRLAADEAERQRLAADQAERQRLAAEEAERRRRAAVEAERQRLTTEKAERQRLAAEESERQRLAAEEAERRRLAAVEADRQRLLAEVAERQRRAAEEAERRRLAAAAAERQRLAAAESERKRLAAEAAKRQRQLAEEAERKRLAAEAAERRRLAAEQARRRKAVAQAAKATKMAALSPSAIDARKTFLADTGRKIPPIAAPMYLTAYASVLTGRSGNAIKALNRLIDADPSLADVHNALALAVLAADPNDHALALKHAEIAVALAPRVPQFAVTRVFADRRQWKLAASGAARLTRAAALSLKQAAGKLLAMRSNARKLGKLLANIEERGGEREFPFVFAGYAKLIKSPRLGFTRPDEKAFDNAQKAIEKKIIALRRRMADGGASTAN